MNDDPSCPPIRCPRCGGRGETFIHVHGIRVDKGTFGEYRSNECRLCSGAGTITPAQARIVDEGERRREKRLEDAGYSVHCLADTSAGFFRGR